MRYPKKSLRGFTKHGKRNCKTTLPGEEVLDCICVSDSNTVLFFRDVFYNPIYNFPMRNNAFVQPNGAYILSRCFILWIFPFRVTPFFPIFHKNKQGTLHLDLLKAHRAQGWTPQLRSRWHRWHRWQGRPRWQTQRRPHKAWGGGAYPTQEVEHGKAVFSNPERPKKRKCGGVKLFLPNKGTSKELTKQNLKMNLRDYGQKLRCLRVCCFVVKFE